MDQPEKEKKLYLPRRWKQLLLVEERCNLQILKGWIVCIIYIKNCGFKLQPQRYELINQGSWTVQMVTKLLKLGCYFTTPACLSLWRFQLQTNGQGPPHCAISLTRATFPLLSQELIPLTGDKPICQGGRFSVETSIAARALLPHK